MEINLSNKNIKDFNIIFNEIKEPEKYVSMDISHNLLTKLPQNLSMFSNLIILNILDNKFNDYKQLSLSLSTLPKLQELTLDLATQEAVIMILTALPNLTKLNGEKTNDTTLQQSVMSKSAVTNNKNVNSNNDNNNNGNNGVVNNLNLEEEDSNDDNERRELSLNDETNIFEYVCKNLNNDMFNKKFQNKLRSEISKINENLDIPNYLYNAHIIKSKLEIYNFIQDEITNVLLNEDSLNLSNIYTNKMNNNVILNIFKIIREKIKENQNQLFELAISFYDKKNNEINCSVTKDNNNQISSKRNLLNENCLNFNFFNKEMISKNELLSILNDIYQYNYSKNKANNKSISNSIDSFLLRKYGLKSIASFWKNKIMEGIEFYHETDSEVNIFKKIIENKIDDYYYFSYKELKRNCVSILIKLIKEKNKNIKNEEIEKILKDKINNNYLAYFEWTKIINVLYGENNQEYINEVISYIEDMDNKNEKYQEINNNKENDKNILFDDFVNEIFNIQVNLREKNKEIISKLFREKDVDNDGYLNKNEFFDFIKSFSKLLYVDESLINELLKSKKNINFISFTDCVKIIFDNFNFNT